jgi:anaphase-promoting complex subunit 2
VHPTIISRHFWPSLESSDIIMPGQFQAFVWFPLSHGRRQLTWVFRLQTDYAKEFSTFKPDKKLRWLPHLGTVHLELQLEDRTIEADVPPLEAAFIELFSEKSACCVLRPSFIALGLTTRARYMDDGRANRRCRRR